jgi:cardiolipin synthase
VQAVTRANYRPLVEAGVKIYEYIPGFIHSKTFLVDDKYAVVGTINMDYRSLFLHFECAVWMFEAECVRDIKQDFLQTLQLSKEASVDDYANLPWHKSAQSAILQLFAPLM